MESGGVIRRSAWVHGSADPPPSVIVLHSLSLTGGGWGYVIQKLIRRRVWWRTIYYKTIYCNSARRIFWIKANVWHHFYFFQTYFLKAVFFLFSGSLPVIWSLLGRVLVCVFISKAGPSLRSWSDTTEKSRFDWYWSGHSSTHYLIPQQAASIYIQYMYTLLYVSDISSD